MNFTNQLRVLNRVDGVLVKFAKYKYGMQGLQNADGCDQEEYEPKQGELTRWWQQSISSNSGHPRSLAYTRMIVRE